MLFHFVVCNNVLWYPWGHIFYFFKRDCWTIIFLYHFLFLFSYFFLIGYFLLQRSSFKSQLCKIHRNCREKLILIFQKEFYSFFVQSDLGSSGHAHYLQYTALEKVLHAYVHLRDFPFFPQNQKKRASTKAFNYTDQFRFIIKLGTCHSVPYLQKVR